MGVVADRSRTPLAGTDCKGELERESRRVRARGLSRGNRYSRALASRRRLWIRYVCQATTCTHLSLNGDTVYGTS